MKKAKPGQHIPAIWQRFLLQSCVCELIPRQCTPPWDGGELVQLRLRDRAPPLQVALHELHRDQFVQCPLTEHEQEFRAKSMDFAFTTQPNTLKG